MNTRVGVSGGCVLVCLLLSASACSDSGDDQTPSGGIALAGRTFLLENAQGYQLVANTTLSLSFQHGEIGFSGGCNHYLGDYSVTADRLVVGGLSGTMIGCSPELHVQDGWYSAFMSSSPAVALEGDRLTLTGETATLYYLDREVANPDRPLVGPTWTINSYIEGETVGGFMGGESPTFAFGEDGSLDVFSGCNTGTGGYTVSGNAVTISGLMYSTIACVDPMQEIKETMVQAVLMDGAVTYEIEANRVTVRRDGVGVMATTQ